MTWAIMRRAFRDHERGLLAYVVGFVLLIVAVGSVYPTVRSNTSYAELVKQYPKELLALFGAKEGSDLSSAPGYLGVELMGFMAPLIMIVQAMGFGSGTIAGEEERGELDLVLAAPVTRSRVLGEKCVALVLGVVALAATFFVAILAVGAATDMKLPVGDLAAGTVALGTLALFFGVLALAIGAATGRRAIAISVAAGFAIVAYLVNALSEVADWLRPLRSLSPVYQTIGRQPLFRGVAVLPTLVLLAVTFAIACAGAWAFRRRDIRA